MPSLINELAFGAISQTVQKSTSFILIDASGLKAAESLSLRRQLCGIGASMQQAKARLICKAVPESVSAHLERSGSLAIVSGEDIAAASKIINELAKSDRLVVCAGLIEGRGVDGRGAARFADLPTKHEAHAMVARAIRAPVVKLGKLLKAPYRRLGRALQAHQEKLAGT